MGGLKDAYGHMYECYIQVFGSESGHISSFFFKTVVAEVEMEAGKFQNRRSRSGSGNGNGSGCG